MVLAKAGYRVDSVPDASDSRVLLGRWKYGAWLLSSRLRNADDAFALIAEMQPRLSDTKIIMLAGLHTDVASVPEPQRHGIVDWLLKNDSSERIIDVVGQAIGPGVPQPGS